jgi:hypothetical protein
MRMEGLVKVKWTWPHGDVIHRCLVATDSSRWLQRTEEANGQLMNRSVDRHVAEGGWLTLDASERHQLVVTVWPLVDLGWTEIVGPPLHLGPFPIVGPASGQGTSRTGDTWLRRLWGD